MLRREVLGECGSDGVVVGKFLLVQESLEIGEEPVIGGGKVRAVRWVGNDLPAKGQHLGLHGLRNMGSGVVVKKEDPMPPRPCAFELRLQLLQLVSVDIGRYSLPVG